MGLKMSKKKMGNVVSDVKEKPDIKIAKPKKKRDIVGAIHRGCRVIIFRTLEVIILFLIISIITLVIGSILLPMFSFSMATSAGLTQSTDIYTAAALWFIPMLFFCLLITAATFCILRRMVKVVHRFFSKMIRKGHLKDLEREGKI